MKITIEKMTRKKVLAAKATGTEVIIVKQAGLVRPVPSDNFYSDR